MDSLSVTSPFCSFLLGLVVRVRVSNHSLWGFGEMYQMKMVICSCMKPELKPVNQ